MKNKGHGLLTDKYKITICSKKELMDVPLTCRGNSILIIVKMCLFFLCMGVYSVHMCRSHPHQSLTFMLEQWRKKILLVK